MCVGGAVRSTLVLVLLVSSLSAPAQLKKGDLLVGVGNGLIRHVSASGTLLGTLDTGTGSQYMTGVCFDFQWNVFATNHSTGQLSKIDATGALVNGSFSTGMSQPESCRRDPSGALLVSETGGGVRKLSPAGETLATYDTGRADWLDLSDDGCTIFYTTEGTVVKRFDACANMALADFATGLPGPCFALRRRANGELLAACGGSAVRVSSAGAIAATYPGSLFTPTTGNLLALTLDPDGQTFWTADYASGEVYRIDIASGAQVGGFQTTPVSFLDSLAVIGDVPLRGDANGDGAVDVVDIFFLVNTLFAAGPQPLGLADANADGSVDVSDIFYLINAFFSGGPPPPG
jgi:DNA-binding beta-propeller fold protein YncE